MNNLYWINFIHFYQPRFIDRGLFDKVVDYSYAPLCDFIEQHPNIKLTINFTACLSLSLAEYGYQNLINRYKKILANQQIELVQSAAFHPLLPLLPTREVIKQIEINHQINRDTFGDHYQPQGFFLPEMAYSKKIETIIAKFGYKYLILDPISIKNKKTNINYQTKYISSQGLQIVFRNRKISQTFVPDSILELSNSNQSNKTIITATDGELYGHQYWNWWPSYDKIAHNKNIITETISEYLLSLKSQTKISLRKSSWESTASELRKNIPYALWKNPNNKIHTHLWHLATFAERLNFQNQSDPNHFSSRLHLENGLASCNWWWASSQDFSHLFADRSWHPEMIEKGALELLKSVRSLEKISTRDKIKAEKMFSKIRQFVWSKHWQ